MNRDISRRDSAAIKGDCRRINRNRNVFIYFPTEQYEDPAILPTALQVHFDGFRDSKPNLCHFDLPESDRLLTPYRQCGK